MILFIFLSRVSILTRDIDIAILPVRLSVAFHFQMTLNDPKPRSQGPSRHSFTLNISEIAKDTAIVTMECE